MQTQTGGTSGPDPALFGTPNGSRSPRWPSRLRLYAHTYIDDLESARCELKALDEPAVVRSGVKNARRELMVASCAAFVRPLETHQRCAGRAPPWSHVFDGAATSAITWREGIAAIPHAASGAHEHHHPNSIGYLVKSDGHLTLGIGSLLYAPWRLRGSSKTEHMIQDLEEACH